MTRLAAILGAKIQVSEGIPRDSIALMQPPIKPVVYPQRWNDWTDEQRIMWYAEQCRGVVIYNIGGTQ